jgi:hypothetical protein
MSYETSQCLYELAFRESDGIEVTLLWDGVEDRVLLNVRDRRTGEWSVCGVDRAEALHAFRHPFAYAARRRTPIQQPLRVGARRPTMLRHVRGLITSPHAPTAHLDLLEPILIRYSRDGHRPAFERLAALEGRRLGEGMFLFAEVDGPRGRRTA